MSKGKPHGGNVTLRPDLRPRLLVLRVAVRECRKVRQPYLLETGRAVEGAHQGNHALLPGASTGGRLYPLEAMLQVHLMQNWFALSDSSMEEALYDIASFRNFVGLKLSEPIADETTIPKLQTPAGRVRPG